MKEIRRFGTFDGVFLPTILSIFGVILFLRTGWVVGYAGLFDALLILTLAEAISFATALSLSAISTNIDVGTGGVYYIVSRSLGVNAGGAIGVPLYLSQAISVAFYIIGFLESVRIFLGTPIDFKIWGTLLLIFFSVLAYIGADFAVKLQYLIFALLLLGISSFLITPAWMPLKINLVPHFDNSYHFWKVFAVFFPAVTGITAGIGLSGELKDPGKSIPRGTIFAVLTSFLVYGIVMWKAASLEPYHVLIENTGIFIRDSRFPLLVLLGIWAATLSSALTFTLGAPRTLQALAEDGVVPRFMGHTLGSKKQEPRMGVIISFFVAEGFILIGNLNQVATIITMFFLITYGISNYSAGIQDLISNPSYRPRFKVPWVISLTGFLGTIFVMFLISPLGMAVALTSVLGIYILLRRKRLHQTWGDSRAGFWISMARYALLKLEEVRLDPLNWRPNLMVFTGNPNTRPYLSKMAQWLSRGHGIVTLFNLLECQSEEDYNKRREAFNELKSFIRKNKLTAFPEVELVKDPWESIPCIAQAHGIGKLYSNVALLGWGGESHKKNHLIRVLRPLVCLHKDVLVLKYDRTRGFGRQRNIDIWWGGKGGNIELMLLVSHIILMNEDWKGGRARIMRVVFNDNKVEEVKKDIEDKLFKARLKAEVEIITNKEHLPLRELIYKFSGDTDLVVMGLPIPNEGEEEVVAERIDSLIKPLGSVLLVRSTFRKEVFND